MTANVVLELVGYALAIAIIFAEGAWMGYMIGRAPRVVREPTKAVDLANKPQAGRMEARNNEV